ncbi:MAG: flagellar biosynthesis protein FliQ [Lachnospirales bacterium]
MTQEIISDIMVLAIKTIIVVSAPPLLLGLLVGLIVSLFQAITSIQEPTLAFVPKILAVFLSLIIFGPFMMSTIETLFMELFTNIQTYVTPY